MKRSFVMSLMLLITVLTAAIHVSLSWAGGKYDLEFRDTDIKDVMRLLGDQEGLNILISEQVSGRITASFKGVEFNEVLDAILKMNGLRAVREGSILRVEVGEEEGVLERRIFKINYAKAETLSKTLSETLSSGGSITVDARTNTLIARDTEYVLDQLESMIEELDKPSPQVMIEARIVEATANFARELGIRWGFDYTHTGDSSIVTAYGTGAGDSLVNLPSDPNYGGIGVTFGKLSGSTSLDLELTAMEDKGFGKIVSSPKIATLNNKTANIRSGVRIPVKGITTSEGITTTDVDYIEAVLSLTVTPQVTSQGNIVMSIDANRSVPDWGNVVDGNPAILTREAATQVMVKNGETVVIGGLLQETEAEDASRVPIVSDIPIIGGVFRNKSKVKDTEELLIFITPRLVEL